MGAAGVFGPVWETVGGTKVPRPKKATGTNYSNRNLQKFENRKSQSTTFSSPQKKFESEAGVRVAGFDVQE